MSSSVLTRPTFQGTTSNVTNPDSSPISSKLVTGMVVTDSSLMFRNKILNGSMTIDQRNSGAAATITANASSVYTLDRWRVFSAGSNATVQRVAGSGSNQYALRITGLASNTGTVLEQRIEAANCYDLVNNTVTVSFQVSSTSITSLNWSADYPTGGVDNWSGATAIASGSVTISSTNNTYSFTFNAGANVVNGLRITFTTGALLGSQTITYQQIQLEAGPTATPFERRPYSVELGMCERYFQIIGSFYAGTAVNSETQGTGAYQTRARMRISPVLVDFSANFHKPGVAFYTITAITSLQSVEDAGYTAFTIQAGAGTGTIGQFNGVLRLQAEL